MTTIYFVRHAQSDYRGGSDRERGLTAEALEDRRGGLLVQPLPPQFGHHPGGGGAFRHDHPYR